MLETDTIMSRLEALRAHMATTQQSLQALDQDRAQLLQLFLRQQGAVQALEEVLAALGTVPLEATGESILR